MARDYSHLIGNQHAIASKPNRTSFRAGQRPWNKGLIGLHLSPATEFQSGHTLTPVFPIGSLTIRRGKAGRERRYIKAESGWIEYATWLWIKQYRLVLLGDVVHHLNGDRLSDCLENLIALPRCDHPIYHSRWGLKPISTDRLDLYRGRYTAVGDQAAVRVEHRAIDTKVHDLPLFAGLPQEVKNSDAETTMGHQKEA